MPLVYNASSQGQYNCLRGMWTSLGKLADAFSLLKHSKRTVTLLSAYPRWMHRLRWCNSMIAAAVLWWNSHFLEAFTVITTHPLAIAILCKSTEVLCIYLNCCGWWKSETNLNIPGMHICGLLLCVAAEFCNCINLPSMWCFVITEGMRPISLLWVLHCPRGKDTRFHSLTTQAHWIIAAQTPAFHSRI